MEISLPIWNIGRGKPSKMQNQSTMVNLRLYYNSFGRFKNTNITLLPSQLKVDCKWLWPWWWLVAWPPCSSCSPPSCDFSCSRYANVGCMLVVWNSWLLNGSDRCWSLIGCSNHTGKKKYILNRTFHQPLLKHQTFIKNRFMFAEDQSEAPMPTPRLPKSRWGGLAADPLGRPKPMVRSHKLVSPSASNDVCM